MNVKLRQLRPVRSAREETFDLFLAAGPGLPDPEN
jgi:hypothetical protein